jgi:hypothetical protein
VVISRAATLPIGSRKRRRDVRVRDSTLRLAKIATIGTVVSVIVGIAAIWFAK